MNRRIYSVIIVIYTILNIAALVIFNINNDNFNSNDVNIAISKNNKKNEIYDNEDISMDIPKEYKDTNIPQDLDEENKSEDKGALTEDLSKKRTQANREKQNQLNKIYESDSEIVKIDEIELDKYNKMVIEKSKVMKIPVDELENNLTILEKAKIVSICKDLNDEDYSEINEFLTYKDERLAVLRTLNVIENKIDEEQVEELKQIFSKYIDMDKVEGN
jgi:hypothetical protein